MRDPERPAFLQVLRTHEIGGRPIPDLLDAITAESLDGSRSIAAVLHGRAGKEPAPERGTTTGWAERTARDATPEIDAAGHMLDARQAALGERPAANPPAWALAAWGVPPAEPGRCGTNGSGARAWWSPTVRRPGSPTRSRRSVRCPLARRTSRRCSMPPSAPWSYPTRRRCCAP